MGVPTVKKMFKSTAGKTVKILLFCYVIFFRQIKVLMNIKMGGRFELVFVFVTVRCSGRNIRLFKNVQYIQLILVSTG
jgi:hypothetical protein